MALVFAVEQVLHPASASAGRFRRTRVSVQSPDGSPVGAGEAKGTDELVVHHGMRGQALRDDDGRVDGALGGTVTPLPRRFECVWGVQGVAKAPSTVRIAFVPVGPSSARPEVSSVKVPAAAVIVVTRSSRGGARSTCRPPNPCQTSSAAFDAGPVPEASPRRTLAVDRRTRARLSLSSRPWTAAGLLQSPALRAEERHRRAGRVGEVFHQQRDAEIALCKGRSGASRRPEATRGWLRKFVCPPQPTVLAGELGARRALRSPGRPPRSRGSRSASAPTSSARPHPHSWRMLGVAGQFGGGGPQLGVPALPWHHELASAGSFGPTQDRRSPSHRPATQAPQSFEGSGRDRGGARLAPAKGAEEHPGPTVCHAQ